MSKHLLRAAMALSLAAVTLAYTAPVHAEDAATAKPEKPKRHQFTGVIESIDAKAGTAIVKKDAESKTFKLGEKTRYSTIEKKDAAVSDIKVGEKVTVTYTEEGGALIAHKIGVPESVKKKEQSEK